MAQPGMTALQRLRGSGECAGLAVTGNAPLRTSNLEITDETAPTDHVCSHCGPCVRRSDAPERLKAAAEAFKEVMGVPDRSIPQELLAKAYCVIIIPDSEEQAPSSLVDNTARASQPAVMTTAWAGRLLVRCVLRAEASASKLAGQKPMSSCSS